MAETTFCCWGSTGMHAGLPARGPVCVYVPLKSAAGLKGGFFANSHLMQFHIKKRSPIFSLYGNYQVFDHVPSLTS
jgi:hypothetical protein